jgi:hypothetical protein
MLEREQVPERRELGARPLLGAQGNARPSVSGPLGLRTPADVGTGSGLICPLFQLPCRTPGGGSQSNSGNR